jgi:cytoskeletal protein CcmA (bactofilin family)
MADKKQGGEAFSVIGSGTVITGDVTTEGTIRIDGRIVGNLTTQADAAIGLTGVIEGSVDARNITVAGKVVGTLIAAKKLILEGKSILKGDLRTVRLVVDEGAVFDGRSSMANGPGVSPPSNPRDQR